MFRFNRVREDFISVALGHTLHPLVCGFFSIVILEFFEFCNKLFIVSLTMYEK